MTLALGEVLGGAGLLTSVVLTVVGALLSYAVRQRDAETERRLVLLEGLAVRVAQLETRASVNEANLTHMGADLSAVRIDVSELLRLARKRRTDHDEE